MDPRRTIYAAVAEGSYIVSRHALTEADKDGISLEMIERVMCFGHTRKIERIPGGAVRYTLRAGTIMTVVELDQEEVFVITAGRQR